jgi:hypothetical protein
MIAAAHPCRGTARTNRHTNAERMDRDIYRIRGD